MSRHPSEWSRLVGVFKTGTPLPWRFYCQLCGAYRNASTQQEIAVQADRHARELCDVAALVRRHHSDECDVKLYREAYEVWKAEGQAMHQVLLKIWRACTLDTEYGAPHSADEVWDAFVAARTGADDE